MEFNPLDIILHLDAYLSLLIDQYGVWIYAILFLVIFCETGLIVLPFLPGDSLLFIAGAMCATGGMDIGLLIPLLMLASLLGDNTNYCIGRFAGARLFRNPNSKIFRQDHLEHTQTFYQKHGGKTVTIARFMPIVRTFAPFVAGMGHMSWPRFVGFSALGSVLWVGGLVGLGYFFGNVPFIKQNLSILVFGIIGVSLLPVVIAAVRGKAQTRA